ncbi:hypothetical protein E4U61_006617, partial [Claviceps capensis]
MCLSHKHQYSVEDQISMEGWSDQTATASENSDGPAEQDGPTEEDLGLAVAMMNDIETEGLAAATVGDDEHSIDSMFKLWQQVIYAPTKTDFDNSWKAMEDQYKDQQHTLDYISDEYMPLLHQWAKYEIDQYRNFGQRVNSPTESAHRQLKTFLKSGTGHLHHMHIAITDMLKHKERTYLECASMMDMRQQLVYSRQPWMGRLPLEVPRIALHLVHTQGLLARASMEPNTEPLRPCRNTFTQQIHSFSLETLRTSQAFVVGLEVQGIRRRQSQITYERK